MTIAIDEHRLTRELEELAAISDVPAPAVTRIVFSDTDVRARAWFRQLCADANLQLREDAVGNTFARWPGADPSLPAVATGSHIDAIPYSGRYDGTVGVLGGLEAIRALQAAGYRPHRSIELILFTAEEPTRFGVGCLGSRLLSGVLDPATADTNLKDPASRTLAELRNAAGFTGTLESVRLAKGHYHAFVELHIEQGPHLEKEGLPLGIVTAIAAPASLRVLIEGQGGHAGAVLMPGRRDALLGAAEIALAVEQAAKSNGAPDTVGTTGVCEVFPGAINSIPSKVKLEIDFRDTDGARRDQALQQLEAAIAEVAARRNLEIRTEWINQDPPTQCASLVIEALEQACAASNLKHKKMISRAYHDSSFMSLIAPVAMLFIPCRAGVSHRPDEYATPEAIATGTQVLASAVATLARR